VIAAGGTGGHIYPGIALAEEIKIRDSKNEVIFIGGSKGIEKKLIKFPLRMIRKPLLFGLFDSLKILWEVKPDRVIATGGYISAAVVLAAKILKIPILLHEQNVLPGRANRICSRFADVTVLSFSESLKYLKGVVLGNPVRRRILDFYKKKNGRFTVFIFGGSQGSKNINTAIVSLLDRFSKMDMDIVHVAGERDYASLPKEEVSFYKMLPYMYNIEEGFADADLVVSRAGATAISEILACGKPSILIPFPYAAENHQELNARAVKAFGAAEILHDNELEKLPDLIGELKADPSRLKKMGEAALAHSSPDAAEKILDLIYEKN